MKITKNLMLNILGFFVLSEVVELNVFSYDFIVLVLSALIFNLAGSAYIFFE